MNNIFNFTKQLVKIASTEDNLSLRKKCLSDIEKKFSNNFYIKHYSLKNRPMMVLSNSKNKKVNFILAGHIDVVPSNINNFTVKDKNNKLYGRGVFDMKGPVAASIYAIRDFLKNNNDLKIAIFLTSDEEIDGASTEYLVKNIGYKSKFALLPDGGNDDDKIIIKEKGFIQIKAEITGKNSHAARPWEGENTIRKALLLYNKLSLKFPSPKNSSEWKTSVNITKINGGEAINQIPNNISLYFDIRYIDKKDKIEIIKIIKSFSKNKIEILAENSPLDVSPNNIYVKKLQNSIKKITNKKVTLVKESATSDAVFFSENGIPAVLYNPKGGGAHEDVEWIDKKSLVSFYKILIDFLENY